MSEGKKKGGKNPVPTGIKPIIPQTPPPEISGSVGKVFFQMPPGKTKLVETAAYLHTLPPKDTSYDAIQELSKMIYDNIEFYKEKGLDKDSICRNIEVGLNQLVALNKIPADDKIYKLEDAFQNLYISFNSGNYHIHTEDQANDLEKPCLQCQKVYALIQKAKMGEL